MPNQAVDPRQSTIAIAGPDPRRSTMTSAPTVAGTSDLLLDSTGGFYLLLDTSGGFRMLLNG
jgi:hypothetical protein